MRELENMSAVRSVHEELVADKDLATRRLETFEQFMAVSGIEVGSMNGHQPVVAPRQLNLKGMSVREALVAYANANGGIVRCTPLAKELVAQGVGDYKSPTAAYGSFYRYLVMDTKQWTKTGPGEFRLNGNSSKPEPPGDAAVTTTPARVQRKYTPAPIASGRDHSICELPPQFRFFPLQSLQGLSYLEAAIATARHAGGTINLQDLGKVFWHADICGKAKSPNVIGAYVWTSAFDPKHGAFTKVGLGTYKLIA